MIHVSNAWPMRMRTLYARVGEVVPLLALAFWLLAMVQVLRTAARDQHITPE